MSSAISQTLDALFQAQHRFQDARLDNQMEKDQCHQQADQENGDQGPQVTGGEQGIQVQQGDLEPANSRQEGNPGQVFFAVYHDKAALNRAFFAVSFFQHLQHAQNLLLVRGSIKQQVDGVLLAFRFDDAGKIDVVAVTVELDSAVVIHEQCGDAFLIDVHDVQKKVIELQPAADHADNVAVFIAHQHINPQLGNAQLLIRIDVEVEVPAFFDQLKEPGVLRFFGVQHIAELVVCKLVFRVVVVVMAVTSERHKVAVIPEISPEALHLAHGFGGQAGVVGVFGPLDQGGGMRHLPGKADFPFQ